ncbi:MAG: CPBP family intramembrane glutamic endopeptidase [Pseudomonadota bacterium]
MTYPGFADFTAPARPTSELWRTLSGILLVTVIYAGGAAGIIAAGTFALQVSGIGTAGDVLTGRTPPALLLVLFHFIAMAAAAIVVTRLLHQRGGWTLLGDRNRLWADFRRMALIAVVVGVVGAAVFAAIMDIAWKLPFSTWLLYLPFALPLILLQTGAEELVFRGYLLQQFGARFGVAARAAWMIIPSLIFAAAHTDPASQGGNWWAVVAITFAFAMVASDITARTGSLGAAWGLHFINNCQAILIFSLAGPLSGLSLGSVGIPASAPAALPLIGIDAVALALIYLIWRRRYG